MGPTAATQLMYIRRDRIYNFEEIFRRASEITQDFDINVNFRCGIIKFLTEFRTTVNVVPTVVLAFFITSQEILNCFLTPLAYHLK